ncbi:LEA type 2 family protein [Persicitalea sp.]|uniref:LEA type 2 family protein n=1 Tax=Persicitalea sp. TaxID=3100273 RepID=UPI003593F506
MNLSKSVKTILFFIFLLLLGFVGYYFYKQKYGNPVTGLKPRLEMGVGRISNITDSTVDMTLNLLIHNPLPIGMDVENMAYTIKMNEQVIIENDYAKSLLIKPHDSITVSLDTELMLKKLVDEINQQDIQGQDSATYHFSGDFHLRKPLLGQDTLHLSMDMRMPVYHLPQVKVRGFDMEKFRLSQSDIILQLELTNDNPFPLEFKNPSYVISVGKQEKLLEGSVKGGTVVKSHSSDLYEIPITVDMGDLLKTAGQFIFKGKSLPFHLTFRCKLASDDAMINDSDLNLLVDGELKDLDKVKKLIDKK